MLWLNLQHGRSCRGDLRVWVPVLLPALLHPPDHSHQYRPAHWRTPNWGPKSWRRWRRRKPEGSVELEDRVHRCVFLLNQQDFLYNPVMKEQRNSGIIFSSGTRSSRRRWISSISLRQFLKSFWTPSQDCYWSPSGWSQLTEEFSVQFGNIWNIQILQPLCLTGLWVSTMDFLLFCSSLT